MTARKREWRDAKGKAHKVWFADFVIAGKRYRERSPVNTSDGATAHERRMREQLADGPVLTSPTLREFGLGEFMVYARNNNKPSVIKEKDDILRLHLLPAWGDWTLDLIDDTAIEAYKAAKTAEGLKPKTVNNQLIVLGKLLALATLRKKIASAPKIRKLRVIARDLEYLSFEDAERAISAAARVGAQDGCFVLAGIHTGMRQGELRALKWADVDLVAGRLVVRTAFWRNVESLPKGNRTREIPLSNRAIAALKAQKALTALHPAGRVFLIAGEVLSPGECDTIVSRAARKAGLIGRAIGCHTLRHTFASHLVMRGRSLSEVQQLMGHASSVMTERYRHLSPTAIRGAVATFDLPVPTGVEQVG